MRKVIHMNIQIELQRRPEDYRLDNCVIDVVEEIPHDSFETFQNYPTARYGAITNGTAFCSWTLTATKASL